MPLFDRNKHPPEFAPELVDEVNAVIDRLGSRKVGRIVTPEGFWGYACLALEIWELFEPFASSADLCLKRAIPSPLPEESPAPQGGVFASPGRRNHFQPPRSHLETNRLHPLVIKRGDRPC
jgi:hypothetical protein